MSEQKTLVEVQHLQQYFPAGGVGKNRKYVQAVDDVSFAIRKGETLGLVGSYRRSRVRPVVVLPQPDSPTRPRVSPLRMAKLTSSTA